MKKTLLTTAIILALNTAYSQVKDSNNLNLKQVEIKYNSKKEKPSPYITAKNIGQDTNFLNNKYFSINLTKKMKKNIPSSKLEKIMTILSGALFDYEGKYIDYKTFLDGKDENIELKRIILSEINENTKDNFKIKSKNIKNLYGKKIIFLEYVRNEKIEQICYFLNKNEFPEELIKELKK